MQLYALLLGLVRAHRSWLPAHIPREYAHSPEPLIHHILSGDDKYILLFLYAGYGIDDAILALFEKHLAGKRVCMVAYGKCQYGPAVFLLCSLQGQYLALYRDVAHSLVHVALLDYFGLFYGLAIYHVRPVGERLFLGLRGLFRLPGRPFLFLGQRQLHGIVRGKLYVSLYAVPIEVI